MNATGSCYSLNGFKRHHVVPQSLRQLLVSLHPEVETVGCEVTDVDRTVLKEKERETITSWKHVRVKTYRQFRYGHSLTSGGYS